MITKTISITHEWPANALALNKDNSQVVIAGRSVFKIFSLLEDKFDEVCNLRVGKNLNLNFSCNDVAWNLNDDHILATAATNGAVVVWNLNRSSRSKQEHVFMDHSRTVNKVSFHMTEPMWLISGSQDGTMKCFDLRIKEAVKTFYSNTESVRDVQFSPHQPHTFAAVSETGQVQQWDVRRPDKYFQHFTAHSGPIFACDWHPETTWLATASRDKTIKIWDFLSKPTCEYTIHTIASVGRIKWRPQRKYHISSCALVVDSSIHVWDVRRPYIPFASFNEHKDVPTGVAWRGDPHYFLSTSRDCTLCHHVFKDATRPASKANPQGIAINLKLDVTFANKVNVNTPSTIKQMTSIIRKPPPNNDTFYLASSAMHRFTSKLKNEKRWFEVCARDYMLTGVFTEMCEHNSAVATNAGRELISNYWKILKTIYASPCGDILKPPATKEDVHGLNLGQMNLNNVVDPNTAKGHEHNKKTMQAENVGIGSGCDDETETDETPEVHNPIGPPISKYSMSTRRSNSNHKRQHRGDFTFGEEEEELEMLLSMSMECNSGGYMGNMANNDEEDWILPKEAFTLRHEIQDRSPPPEQFPIHLPDLSDDPQSVTDENQPFQLVVTQIPKPKPLDLTDTVEAALKFHVDIGDVQTAVTMLFVIGDIRKNLNIEMAVQEHWLLSYIDLLGRYKLWEVAAQVIKLAWIPSISQLNQQSTSVNICCSTCTKQLQRTGWLCDRCHFSKHSMCSLCHQVAKGSYVWCQGCTHGGHLSHVKEWFATNRQCPAGCGHICEFT